MLLLGALLSFGLGQVMGHPDPHRAARPAPVTARHVAAAPGSLAPSAQASLAQPLPLAAPPSQSAAPTPRATPQAEHNKDGGGSGKHHDGHGGDGGDGGGGNHQGHGKDD